MFQRDAGWIQETSVVDALVVRASGSLKAEWTRTQNTIPTTIERVLDLGRETLVSRDGLQKRSTSKEGEDARDAKAREKLKIELSDV